VARRPLMVVATSSSSSVGLKQLEGCQGGHQGASLRSAWRWGPGYSAGRESCQRRAEVALAKWAARSGQMAASR
jgi:hypothetical protein